MKKLYDFARYTAGFLIIIYAFAKLNGAQFTIIESELDKPMREVKGFWLTWYYFSYAPAYGNSVAIMQLLAGIGLMFRRTTLLSALLLLGVMGNILMVDYFFDIPMSGAMVAIIITILTLIVLIPHVKELVDFFYTRQNIVYGNTKAGAGIWVLRVLLIGLPVLITWYTANVNNRKPTPVDGKWAVVSKQQSNTVFDSVDYMYFERNRAFMVVFKHPHSWAQHHFEVKGNNITMHEKYMAESAELLNGTYAVTSGQLTIADVKRQVNIVLARQ